MCFQSQFLIVFQTCLVIILGSEKEEVDFFVLLKCCKKHVKLPQSLGAHIFLTYAPKWFLTTQECLEPIKETKKSPISTQLKSTTCS